MIDFKEFDKERRRVPDIVSVRKEADEFLNVLRAGFDKSKTDKFLIGVKLISLYKSGSYGSYMAGDASGKSFFLFCSGHLDLNKSSVSRYMNVVDEYGDKFEGFKDKWKKYTWSALVEMLPLTKEQRERFKPDTPVSEIRAYKKSLKKAVATSQQNKKEENSENESDRFKEYSRSELIDYIEKLEASIRDIIESDEIDCELLKDIIGTS